MFDRLELMTGLAALLLLAVWAVGIFAAVAFTHAEKMRRRVMELEHALDAAQRQIRGLTALSPSDLTSTSTEDIAPGEVVYDVPTHESLQIWSSPADHAQMN